eukprot:GCRY01001566.1.p1 GENE.GCRY01001566.1~~GCRY01001566.1.p1  ORF type:complete len:538 (-),score=143.11 GCRY01001566.1:235-1848(-)
MSQFDAIEPTVIDEDLLDRCIVLDLSEYENATIIANVPSPSDEQKIARELPLYKDVKTLRLSFKNILKINNLDGFHSLTKLQLDNNVIEKIEGLQHLTNLTWLDLSFNNIRRIEGLDTLTKLTDLSLFSNHIETLEGLDNLKELNCLSIGNNELKTLAEVKYLRQFQQLRMLNLSGNAFCADTNYQSTCLAYLKHLRYLDYRLIDSDSVTAAREQHQDELVVLETKENLQQFKVVENEEKDRNRVQLQEANAYDAFIIYQTLFESPEDELTQRLSHLPRSESLRTDLQEKIAPLVTDHTAFMLKQLKVWKEEEAMFSEKVAQALDDNEAHIHKYVDHFNKICKHAFVTLSRNEKLDLDPVLADLKMKNFELRDSLMELEVRRTEVFLGEGSDVGMIKTFEQRLLEISALSVENIQTFFGKIRLLENEFFEAISIIALQVIEDFNAGKLEDVADSLKSLLLDKDGMMNVVSLSHEARIGKVDSKEDEAITAETRRLEACLHSLKADEHARNRNRILEIGQLIDYNHSQIEHYDPEDWL